MVDNPYRQGQIGNYKFPKDYIASRHEDAFENFITEGIINEADLSANYPYSPERYRLFKNGVRLFPEYNSVAEYSDLIDSHELIPAQGDVLKFRTAERFSYRVGYVIEPSFAFSLSRSPQEEDVFIVGYGDADLESAALDQSVGPNADGWFFVFDSSIQSHQVKVEEYRQGTQIGAKVASLNRLITIWKRLAIDINWYNVGRNSFYETYTENGEQFNPLLADLSVDYDKGPAIANNRVEFAIRRGSATNAITANIGSIGLKTYGDFRPLKRAKQGVLDLSLPDTTSSWQAVAALRTATDKNVINTQLTTFDVLGFDGNNNLQVLLVAVDPSQTDATGFATPADQTSFATTVELTTNISTFPDNTGTVVSSTSNPGGHQLLQAGVFSGKTLTSTVKSESTIKQVLYEDDIAVILVKTSEAADATLGYESTQDW